MAKQYVKAKAGISAGHIRPDMNPNVYSHCIPDYDKKRYVEPPLNQVCRYCYFHSGKQKIESVIPATKAKELLLLLLERLPKGKSDVTKILCYGPCNYHKDTEDPSVVFPCNMNYTHELDSTAGGKVEEHRVCNGIDGSGGCTAFTNLGDRYQPKRQNKEGKEVAFELFKELFCFLNEKFDSVTTKEILLASKNSSRCTALHYAFRYNDTAMIKFLWERLGDTQKSRLEEVGKHRDRSGSSPFHYAFRYNDTAMIKFLWGCLGRAPKSRLEEVGKHRDHGDTSPLHYAFQYGEIEMIKFLWGDLGRTPESRLKEAKQHINNHGASSFTFLLKNKNPEVKRWVETSKF